MKWPMRNTEERKEIGYALYKQKRNLVNSLALAEWTRHGASDAGCVVSNPRGGAYVCKHKRSTFDHWLLGLVA